MSMTLEELRQSRFHKELGRKMCAAFVAQQQGITVGTALKKVPDQIAMRGCLSRTLRNALSTRRWNRVSAGGIFRRSPNW